jgi:hypothetical protein
MVISTDEPDVLQEEVNERTGLNITTTSRSLSISGKSEQLKTLEDVIRVCEVDERIWQVIRHKIHPYEVSRKEVERDLHFDEGKITGHLFDTGKILTKTLYSIEVTFTKRVEAPQLLAIDALKESLANFPAEPSPTYHQFKEDAHVLVVGLVDTHWNKRDIGEQRSLEQTSQDFINAGQALLQKTQQRNIPLSKIVLPVGNDALHSDGLNSRTTAGTEIETVYDARDAVQTVVESYVTLIRLLKQVAEVDVVVVPGNHDEYTSYLIGMTLQGWFICDSSVTVYNDKNSRKYFLYGKNLIGFDHGRRIKPAKYLGLMAVEASDLWGQSQYREWLTGHLHHERGMYHPVVEEEGVTVRTLPALCGTDNWHYMMGFVGRQQAAQGLLYHPEYGPAGDVRVFQKELQDGREG